MYSFPNLEPVCCSTSCSNCCFLTCIQISQETGKLDLYSHSWRILHSLTYMQSTSWETLEESQAGIKIAGRNISKLRYADDTTLMAESEEELRSLLMKVKEESEKVGLNLDIQKTKIMASGLITSWQIDGETVETVSDYFSGLQNHCRWWLQQ